MYESDMHPVAKAWADPVARAKRIAAIKAGVRKAFKDPKKRKRHLDAVRRGGETRTTPVEERFWSYVDKNGPTQSHMKTRCWVWAGTTMPGRATERTYGLLHMGGKHGPKQIAHRYSYELHKGSIEGLQVQHRCDNPLCVRPAHLKLGTQQDNSNDMKKRNRPRGRYRTTAKP